MEFILISGANLDRAYPTFDLLVKHSSASVTDSFYLYLKPFHCTLPTPVVNYRRWFIQRSDAPVAQRIEHRPPEPVA